MSKKQNGFTLVEGLLIVLILCIVSFAGFYVINNKKNGKQVTNSATSDTVKTTPTDTVVTKADPYKDWKSYKMTKSAISFKYPASWTIATQPSSSDNDYEKIVLTATDKSEIRLSLFKFLGGFSGDEPYTTLDDVIEASAIDTGVTYTMITYKSEGVYSASYIRTAEKGKYKVGDKFQLLPFWMSAKLANGNTVQFSVAVSGDGDESFGKSKTYTSLAEYKKMESYQQAQKFLESLQIK